MAVTEHDLRALLAERAADAPAQPNRYAAVETRARAIRRRRAVVASGMVAAAVVAAAVAGGVGAEPTALVPPPAEQTPSPGPAVSVAMPRTYGGGERLDPVVTATASEPTEATGTVDLARGRHAVAVTCDTGEVTLESRWPNGQTSTATTFCSEATVFPDTGGDPRWVDRGAGGLTVTVRVSEPQRSPWGAAVYRQHEQWNRRTMNGPPTLGGLSLSYTIFHGGSGGGAEVAFTVTRKAAPPAFLIECSGGQTVQLIANRRPLGAPVSCADVAYERHVVTPAAPALAAVGWRPGTVRFEARATGGHRGTLLIASVYGA